MLANDIITLVLLKMVFTIDQFDPPMSSRLIN